MRATTEILKPENLVELTVQVLEYGAPPEPVLLEVFEP